MNTSLPFGILPTHWKVERLDRLFRVVKESAYLEDESVSAFIDGVVTLRSNRPDAIIKGSGQEIGYKHLERGDLVISGMNAHLGGLGISDSSGKCTPVYTILRKTRDLYERYISYYLWHAAKSGYIKSLVNAVRYNSADFGPETIKNFMVPVPPIEEQQRIANFLDQRSTIMSEISLARKEQLNLVNSLLRSQIETDLRESKFEVKHMRLSRLLKGVKTGSTPDISLNDPSGIPWYTPAAISEFNGLGPEARNISISKVGEHRVTIFPEESVLIVGIGDVGRVAVLDHTASGNQQLTCLTPNERILPEFLYFYLMSKKSELLSLANFTTLPILNNDFLKSIPIPTPSISLQVELVNKWKNLQITIQKLGSCLEELKLLHNEQTIALISGAVSGNQLATSDNLDKNYE